jgi:beta-galactosidase
MEGIPTQARIRVAVPPGAWKRSAFNGLAQVIVQSTKQPGDITLTGSSPGLASGVRKLRTTPSALRPAIPENQETQ